MNKAKKTARKQKPTAPCSALVCVYEKDDADHFEAAVGSLIKQTVQPDEIVIVGDGKLSKGLYAKIDTLKKRSPSINYYELDRNSGIGAASNFGISKCKNELIAKMDSDDISLPERIEKQVAEFEKNPEISILGGQIEEFANNDPDRVVSRREVPTEPEKIIRFARRRSPLNNPTVMFRKSDILSVGGYPEMNRAEDYLLFAKLIAAKKILRNLPDVLVKYRLDADNIKRRKSWSNTKEMINARKEAYKLGVARWVDYAFMKVSFLCLFIAPSGLAKISYRLGLRK